LDSSKVADRHVIRAGKDAVCEIAGCRQVSEVDDRLARCECKQSIFVFAGSADVAEIDLGLCHIRLPLPSSGDDRMQFDSLNEVTRLHPSSPHGSVYNSALV